MRIDNPSISGSLSFIGGNNSISATSVNLTGSFSGSVVGTFEGAFSSTATANISGAFDSVSSSLASRIASQESFSSSLDNTFATDAQVSTAVSSLNAATSSYLQNTTDTLTGDLTVTGTITAQDLHVQEVTSSIVYSSGSNIFGTDSSNTQILYGSVGIGTDSPSHKLELKGISTALTSDSDMRFYIDRSSASYLGSIIFTTGGASVSNGWAEIGQTDANGDLYFKANASAASYDTRMVIKGSNGRVGIGTTSPSGDLEISGSGNSNRTITFNPSFNDDISISSMGVDGSGYNAVTIGQANSQNNSGVFRFKYTGAGSTNNYVGLGFYANDDKLVIRANGNVGLGTNSPAFKLDVSGSINTNNFIRTTNTTSGLITDTITAYNSGIKLNTNLNTRPITFEIDSNEKMRIHTSGNVGVGTTAPSSSLHVYDSTASRLTVGQYGAPHYTQSGMAYQVIRATSDNAARALLELHSGNQLVKANVQAVGANNTVYFGALTNSNASFGNSGDAFFFNTSDKVGLGTTTNYGKLTIKGNGSENTYSGVLRIFNSNTTDPWGGISFPDNGDVTTTSNNYYLIGRGTSISSRVLSIHVPTASDYGSGSEPTIGFYSTGTDLLFNVEANTGDAYHKGSVGIGTDGPLAPLHVHTGAAGTGATGSFQDNTALGIESTSDQYIEMLTSGGSNGQMQGILFSDNGRNAFIGYKEYTGAVANTKGEALHLAFRDFSGSDTNNGIYFGTSTTPWLGVDTTHMFIKGNGNVGIGTTAPGDKLDVRGNVLVDYGIYFKRGGTDYSTYIRSANYPSQTYTSTSERYWVELGSKGGTHIVLNTDGGAGSVLNSYDHFTIWQGAVDGDKLMVVDNVGNGYYAGKLGIGTTAPGAKLTVAATATGDTRNLLLSNLNDTNADSVSIGFSMLANNTYVKSGIMFERTLNGGRGNLYLMTNSATDGTNVSKSDARLTVQHDGKIGINTTSPSYQLDVNGNVKLDYSLLGRSMRSADRGELILNATGTNDVSEVLFGYGNGYTENNLRWGISDRGTADGSLRFYIGPALSGWAEVMVLKASGKEAHFYGSVGIGTTSPQSKLHVAKEGNRNGGSLLIGVGGSGSNKWSYLAGTHYDQASGSGNGAGSAGVALIGSNSTSSNNNVYIGGGPYEINPATNIYFYTYSATTHSLGGTFAMSIDSGQNVGIGTIAPSGKLNIYGTGTANAPTLAIDNTSSSQFVHTLEAFSGNMTAGQHNIMVVGKEGNTKNSGYVGYTWAGAGSDSNFVTLGHWGADDLLRVYGNGDVRSGTNYKSAGWNWVTTPYHYYAATTNASMVTVDVNSDFTVNGNSAIPSYAKALYVTYYYHISGYGIGSVGQGDHANDIWGPDYSVTTTSWSFTTSGNYDWGAAVFMHDGDASENGDMGYYGVWFPGAIIPVNSNGNIYGYLSHGYSGGTHYHHMYVWGYAL